MHVIYILGIRILLRLFDTVPVNCSCFGLVKLLQGSDMYMSGHSISRRFIMCMTLCIYTDSQSLCKRLRIHNRYARMAMVPYTDEVFNGQGNVCMPAY